MIRKNRAMQTAMNHSHVGYLIIGFMTLIVTVLLVNNSVLIYDDLFIPFIFRNHVHSLGYWKSILTVLFNFDLPGEYRTYGLSRVIQMTLWVIGGANPVVYNIWIGATQGATAVAFYKLLRLHKMHDWQSLSLALMWLCSPFAAMNCFHHYSYIVLPYQIGIIFSLWITIRMNCYAPTQWTPLFSLQWCIVVATGVALALTGEAHIVPIIVLFYAIFRSNGRQIKEGWFITIVITLVVAVAIHYSVWRVWGYKSEVNPRFVLHFVSLKSLFNNTGFFIASFWKGFLNELQLIVKYSHPVGLFVVAIVLTAFVFNVFIRKSFLRISPHASATGHGTGWVLNRAISQVNAHHILIGCTIFGGSLLLYAGLGIISGQMGTFLTFRYGAVPYTFFCMLIMMAMPLISLKHAKFLQLCFLVFYLSFYFRLEYVVRPAIRSEDAKVITMMEKLKKTGRYEALIFQNCGGPVLPDSVTTSLPGLRGIDAKGEILESIFLSYWIQAYYAHYVLGFRLVGGAYESSSENKIIPVSLYYNPNNSNNEAIAIEKVAAVVNTAQDCNRTDLRDVKIFTDLAAVPRGSVKYKPIDNIVDVVGSWSANGGQGKIELTVNGAIKITNENNDVSKAKLSGGVLEATDWNVIGRLSGDKSHLIWSNRSVWRKIMDNHGLLQDIIDWLKLF